MDREEYIKKSGVNSLNPLRTFESDMEELRNAGKPVPAKSPLPESVPTVENIVVPTAKKPENIYENEDVHDMDAELRAKTSPEINPRGDTGESGENLADNQREGGATGKIPQKEETLDVDSYREPILPKEARTRAESTPYALSKKPEATERPEVNTSSLHTLRTFEDDVKDAVSNQKTSVVTMALAEEKRKDRDGLRNLPVATRSSIRYIVLSLCFIALGGGVLAYMYIWRTPTTLTTNTSARSGLITPDTKLSIRTDTLTPQSLRDIINSQNTIEGLGANGIKTITLTKGSGASETEIGGTEFFEALGAGAPPALKRSIDSIYSFGIENNAGNPSPFAILTTKSFETAFAGMLEWEGTMRDSLLLSTSGAVSGTPTFEDNLIRNHDTRILRDDLGNIVIIYSFFDKKTLVIATSEGAWNELLTRLVAAAKIAR